jgi:hypothetical protein
VAAAGQARSCTITHVPIREKLISEISAADIFDLTTQRTPEDLFLEFMPIVSLDRLRDLAIEHQAVERPASSVGSWSSGGGSFPQQRQTH